MRVPILVSFSILITAVPTLAQTSTTDKRSLFRDNFNQADANQDGKLSKPEFRQLIDENAKDDLGRASIVKRLGAYDTAFGRLDANKDGFVTKSEIAAAAKK